MTYHKIKFWFLIRVLIRPIYWWLEYLFQKHGFVFFLQLWKINFKIKIEGICEVVTKRKRCYIQVDRRTEDVTYRWTDERKINRRADWKMEEQILFYRKYPKNNFVKFHSLLPQRGRMLDWMRKATSIFKDIYVCILRFSI